MTNAWTKVREVDEWWRTARNKPDDTCSDRCPKRRLFSLKISISSTTMYFEEMTGLEDEMLDSFVRGELPGKDADKFQKEYLTSPARQAKAGFAGMLASHLSGSAKASSVPPHASRKVISIFPQIFFDRRSFAVMAAALF